MIKEEYYGENINELIQFFNCDIKGVLHVGAHKCEELSTYTKYTNNIVWIEAIKSLVEENLQLNPDLNIINEISLINSFLKTSYNSELFKISFSHFDVSNPITPRRILQLIALKL